MIEHVISVETLTQLRAHPGNIANTIMTCGAITKGDNLGKLYYFDSSDNTTPEDTSNYNVIIPTSGIGRYKAVFTRMIQLPHGVLCINGGKKEFYINSTTIADGTCTINLTLDNTVNGTAIFNEIWFDDSKATVNTTTANDAVSSCRKSLTVNLKQLTHLFFRGNSTAVSILGVNVLSFRTALTATPVTFSITGK